VLQSSIGQRLLRELIKVQAESALTALAIISGHSAQTRLILGHTVSHTRTSGQANSFCSLVGMAPCIANFNTSSTTVPRAFPDRTFSPNCNKFRP